LTHPYAYQEIRQAAVPTAEDEVELADLRRRILEALPEVHETLARWHPDLTATVGRALDSARSLHDLILRSEFRETFRRDWGLVQQALASGIGEVRLDARRSGNPVVWFSRASAGLRHSVTPRDLTWWFILALAAWKVYDLVEPILRDLWAFIRWGLAGVLG
jgi:hypothetical protein